MKSIKLFLDTEDEPELQLSLVRLAKDLPAHELFYHINSSNDSLTFKRIRDLSFQGQFNDYQHIRFQAWHCDTKSFLQFIANKSTSFTVKQPQNQLFAEEEDINYLLPFHKEVDYVLKSSDNVADFSVILLPENLTFPIQPYTLASDDPLYDLIQYYE